MKRSLAALACFLLLCACGTSDDVPTPAPLPEAEGLRIAVASDLHFDPDNTDKRAGLGAVAYNPELIDALLFDASAQGAELLLLTGDLATERETILAMRGREPFFRCAKGYAYEWWLRDLIENAPPELGGFTISISKGE